MKPSLKSFKKIVQEPGHPVNFYRKISIWISWLLISTPITPAIVTGSWVFLGILGASMLWFLSYPYNIISGLLLVLVPILDFVDGEVARYKRFKSKGKKFKSSPFWNFWDWAGFWIIMLISVGGAAYHTFKITNNWLYLALGYAIIFGYSMMEFIRMYFIINAYRVPDKVPSSKKIPKIYSSYSLFRKVALVEFFHTVLFITLIFNFVQFTLIFYAIVFNLMWIGKITYETFIGLKEY